MKTPRTGPARAAGYLVLTTLSLLLLSMGIGCRPEPEHSDGVRLMLSGDTLEPTTTFELRFDEPAVDDAMIGQTATNSPVVISPALAGHFVWLSRRSGVYTPTEPLALGHTYDVALRAGMRRPDGTPLNARLLRRFNTPDFGIDQFTPRYFNTNDAPAEPRFKLLFNAEVDPDLACKFIDFRDETEQRMAAAVVHVTNGFYYGGDLDYVNTLTWSQRFHTTRRDRLEGITPNANEPDTNAIRHYLIVAPVRPLPVGTNWQLAVQKGLPSTENGLKLRKTVNITIGNVVPLAVTDVVPANGLRSGKRLRVSFNKPLAPEISDTNILEWIDVTPRPAGFEAVVSRQRVEFMGGFRVEERYMVKVRHGLPAVGGFQLAQDFEQEVLFATLPPRLYFPSFATEQLSGGNRRLELLSVNVPSIRLRAKILDRDSLVHALRGYRGYYKADWESDFEEPYREVDFNLMAGRTLFVTNLTASAPTDQAVRTPLSWDELLGGKRFGAVFLAAEMNPDGGGGSWRRQQDAPRAQLGTQTLIQLTDLGLYWKRTRDRLAATVFSYATGKPVSGVTLRLLDNDGQVLQEGITEGVAFSAFPFRTNTVWLMAEKDGDLHAVRVVEGWENQLPVNGNVNQEWEGSEASKRKLYLFSDRPLYRPGETVQLKALLREDAGDHLSIPVCTNATLVCHDARDRKYYETNLVFSDMGSAEVAIQLPEGVRGSWRIELNTFDNTLTRTHFFQVQDFQPNAFEIEIKTPPVVAAGQPINLPIEARYYQGRPLNKARLKWSLEARDNVFTPDGYEDFLFCSQVHYLPGRSDAFYSQTGETNYTSQPPLVLAPEVPMNPTAPQPRTIDFLVEMTDAGQQTLSKRTIITRHASDFYLGLKQFKQVVRAGQPLSIHLVAVKADGQPEPTPIEVRLRLQRVEWRAVRIQGAGQVAGYRSEPEFTLESEQTAKTLVMQREGIKWSLPPECPPSATLEPAHGGLYLLEALAKDSDGREVITAITFHATQRDTLAWNYRNEVQVELVPDQTSYQAGQEAVILVKTPISGVAWVTVERDRILRSFTTNLTGNAPAIRIPLKPEDAPNVYVSVFITRGFEQSPRQAREPEYRVGYCSLTVDNPAHRLVVDVQPTAAEYRPGQAIDVEGTVRDGLGNPTQGAEVILWAVDEGILSLMSWEVPNPLASFWDQRLLGVWSHSSLPSLFPEDPAQMSFQNKGYLIGGGGENGRSRVRKNFLPCAYWNGVLKTDAQGRIHARFTAPDALTRYKLIAVAHTASQFGHGESAVTVNKPLMLEPALPRFARLGDHLTARAVLRSMSDTAGTTDVTLTLDGTAQSLDAATLGKTVSKTVSLAAHGETVVEFPLELTDTGTARWTWTARLAQAGDFTDAVQSTLAIEHAAPLLHEVHVLRARTPSTNLLAEANPQLLEGRGTATVTISNSRLGQLSEAARHLLHYPYGCAEQTASSLLPWIVLRDFQGTLPELSLNDAEITRNVGQGIQRLLSMQVAGGGLTYWPGRYQPSLWVSAYGGLVLAMAQKHGFGVPQESMEELFKYLEKEVRSTTGILDNIDASDRCLALHALALAGRPQPAIHERFYEQRERLSMENRSLLALAIMTSGGPKDMAMEMLKPKRQTITQGDLWFACPERELALQLLAWCQLQPNAPEVEVLAEELLNSRREGHWTTTQGNAWTLCALVEYVHKVEGNDKDASGALAWASEQKAFLLPKTPAIFETSFLTGSERSHQPLLLENPDQRTLFTTLKLECRPKVIRQPRQDREYSIQRQYALVDDDGTIREFKDARVGDRVLITLRLEVRHAAHYLAIDDPWPAVFEPVNPEFKTQDTRASETLTADWVSDFREFRQDRALFFRDHISPGSYAIRYLARVRAAGTVVAPGAKVEEMYHPERFGISESTEVTCHPLD